MPSPTFAQVERLRRACDTLLRELSAALEKALLSFEDPARGAEPFLARLGQLEREGQQLQREVPDAADYLAGLRQATREQAERLIARAGAAHQRRPRVEGGLQSSYNRLVGPAIAQLPGQATQALRAQVERSMRDLVDHVVTRPEVPGDVKAHMSRQLSAWVLTQPAVEDAFLVAQGALMEVARFLHERLTIHGQLVALKDHTAGQDLLSPAQAEGADQQAGALARRSVDLDAEIARRIEQSATRVSAHARLNPVLVLDPARRFLARLDASAGITIKRSDVRIDLGTRIQISDPLLPNAGARVGVTDSLDLRLGNDVTLSAQHQAAFLNGALQNNLYKVSLSWSF